MPLTGASATTASVKVRRRWVPAGCPAAPQLFLDVDGLGSRQTQCQPGIIALKGSHFGYKRVGFGNLRAAFARNQCGEGPGVALPSSVSESR
jgi:hypothetical protein